MKLIWIALVLVIIGVNCAPKNKKEKSCKSCEKKLGKIWPLCGQFDGIPDTYKNLDQFECLAKCQKVGFKELIHTGPCMKDRHNPDYTSYLFLAEYSPLYNQTYPNYQ